jgi:hypothetical protein
VLDSPQLATSVFFATPQSIWGDGSGKIYVMTFRDVLLYLVTDKTIQLLAYSDLVAQKTGADGISVPFLDPGFVFHDWRCH